MANTEKKAVVRALVEGVLTDLLVKTSAEQVMYDASTTLAAKLAEIIADLSEKADASALTGYATTSAMTTAISEAISGLIDGAPETYDTLKEIADYINNNEDAMSALNAAIGNKVDKVEGKGLSAEDFTSALKSKLEAIEAGAQVNVIETVKVNGAPVEAVDKAVDIAVPTGALASKSTVSETDLDSALKEKVNAAAEGNHSHENKAVLDGITSEKVSSWDGKSRVIVAATQPEDLAAGDLWIQVLD